MKITHIIEATATGTLSMAALLSNAQVENYDRVEVIYSVRPESPETLKDQFDSRITLTRVQMHKPYEKITSLFKLRRLLKATKPEVVILHSSFAGFLGRLAALGFSPKMRFFYIPHCISFMRKDVDQFKKFIFTTFEWLGAIKQSEYIACSKSEQREIQSRVPFRRCHLVENAVKFTHLTPDRRTPTKKVVTVGQIRPQKAPWQFATIAKQVIKDNPDSSFTWVGDGDPAIRRLLEQAGVNVTGWVNREDVWDHLLESDLYLSTARWEGMPVSLIEASYARLPLIASRCAGNVDVVTNNETGWLFDSPEEAAELINAAFNSPQEAFIKAEKAFNEAKTRFSVQRYIEEMDSLIRSYT